MHAGKQQKIPKYLGPGQSCGRPGRGSRLLPEPSPVIVAIWEVGQQQEILFFSLSLSTSPYAFQIGK